MHRKKIVLWSMLLPIFIIGCSNNTDSAKDTQVVAKVNDTEVTVHQLNYEMGLLGAAGAQNTDKVAEKILDNLIKQELVAQKAIAEKIDRDPQVMQALDRAKRQVLAQAYIKKVTERDGTPPAKQEISDYYNQHPELFAKRRIYQIREILLDKTLPMVELQSKMKEAMSLETLLKWLESKNVKMQSGVVVKPAEQLPFEMLSRLAQMQQGQVMAVETLSNISLSVLMDIRDQPLTEAQATPSIERFLIAQKREKLAEAEIKRLRSEAKVEFLGKFAAQGKAAATESTPMEKPDQKSNGNDFIEKGAAGL